MFSLSLSNLFFSFESSGGDRLQLDSYILRNYRADKSHRLQLFKSKTGDRKYEHEMRDVNMNNQMKHVLVLDTINSTRNGSFHRSEKKVGITFMSHEQVLVERDSRSPHEAQNQNNINSFDDDGLKRSCAKYKDSE